jgi:hypothetical protein
VGALRLPSLATAERMADVGRRLAGMQAIHQQAETRAAADPANTG